MARCSGLEFRGHSAPLHRTCRGATPRVHLGPGDLGAKSQTWGQGARVPLHVSSQGPCKEGAEILTF